MSGIPKRLCAASPTIEGNFASLWKVIEVLLHLVDWNMHRIRYRSGLLDFGRSADIHDHQRFRSLNLLFQVRNRNAFRGFILHIAIYDTSA